MPKIISDRIKDFDIPIRSFLPSAGLVNRNGYIYSPDALDSMALSWIEKKIGWDKNKADNIRVFLIGDAE